MPFGVLVMRDGGPFEGGRLGDEPSDVFIGERPRGGIRGLELPLSLFAPTNSDGSGVESKICSQHPMHSLADETPYPCFTDFARTLPFPKTRLSGCYRARALEVISQETRRFRQ